MNEELCPHPWKIRFPSRREALVYSKTGKTSNRLKGQLRPYSCACGGWHLSTLNRKQHKQMLKRKQRATGAA